MFPHEALSKLLDIVNSRLGDVGAAGLRNIAELIPETLDLLRLASIANRSSRC